MFDKHNTKNWTVVIDLQPNSHSGCNVRVKMMPTYYSDTDLRVSSSEKAYNLRSVKAAEKVSTVNSQHPHTGRHIYHYI